MSIFRLRGTDCASAITGPGAWAAVFCRSVNGDHFRCWSLSRPSTSTVLRTCSFVIVSGCCGRGVHFCPEIFWSSHMNACTWCAPPGLAPVPQAPISTPLCLLSALKPHSVIPPCLMFAGFLGINSGLPTWPMSLPFPLPIFDLLCLLNLHNTRMLSEKA